MRKKPRHQLRGRTTLRLHRHAANGAVNLVWTTRFVRFAAFTVAASGSKAATHRRRVLRSATTLFGTATVSSVRANGAIPLFVVATDFFAGEGASRRRTLSVALARHAQAKRHKQKEEKHFLEKKRGTKKKLDKNNTTKINKSIKPTSLQRNFVAS
jgi:hypothetical protein